MSNKQKECDGLDCAWCCECNCPRELKDKRKQLMSKQILDISVNYSFDISKIGGDK